MSKLTSALIENAKVELKCAAKEEFLVAVYNTKQQRHEHLYVADL